MHLILWGFSEMEHEAENSFELQNQQTGHRERKKQGLSAPKRKKPESKEILINVKSCKVTYMNPISLLQTHQMISPLKDILSELTHRGICYFYKNQNIT